MALIRYIAATCVTSSLFLTALAPNLLAIELVKRIANVQINWLQWFVAFAPAGIVLLLAVPAPTFWLYPPEIKKSDEAVEWARRELNKTGPITLHEIILSVLVVIALSLWIFGGSYVNATTVALIVTVLMLATRMG
jgi:L-tartrate/succinate antiporter